MHSSSSSSPYATSHPLQHPPPSESSFSLFLLFLFSFTLLFLPLSSLPFLPSLIRSAVSLHERWYVALLIRSFYFFPLWRSYNYTLSLLYPSFTVRHGSIILIDQTILSMDLSILLRMIDRVG